MWVIDQVKGQDGLAIDQTPFLCVFMDQTLFICVFMDQNAVETHKLAKKERTQYPAILMGQAWSIKKIQY